MATITETFTRRNGKKFTMTVTVDMQRLVQAMAQKHSMTGRIRQLQCGGAIVAVAEDVIETTDAGKEYLSDA